MARKAARVNIYNLVSLSYSYTRIYHISPVGTASAKSVNVRLYIN